MVRSGDDSVFNLQRNYHCSAKGTIFRAVSNVGNIPVPPHPCQHFLLFVFLIELPSLVGNGISPGL